MTYPEPPPSLSSLSHINLSPGQPTVLRSSSGLQLEVECLRDIGWSLELRYDLLSSDNWRQPFTGAQGSVARCELELLREDASRIVLGAPAGTLELAKHDGAFIVTEHGVSFGATVGAPFSAHPSPVKLFEQLMSRKVTDLTGRTFSSPANTHYETKMVRFQYARPDGPVLGLAGQTGELNRNGYRFELYNTDEFVHTPARKPMYQSWPILFHRSADQSGWVAVFHDNPSRTFVDVGDFYSDRVTFESLTNNTRVYICLGRTLREVSQKMARLLGGVAQLPDWAFGYQQCRWSYLSTAEVRDVVARMQREHIPLDAIYFDIDYMDGYRVFTKSPERFADFGDCIRELKQDGVHTVAIVDPGVKIDEEYSVYKAVKESEAYLKLADGTSLPAKVWPGSVLLPDFGDARMQATWSDIQSRWLLENPLDGIWNDMNEPSNFEGGNAATAKSVTVRGPFSQESNLYGFYMAQTSAAGFAKAFPDKRGLIITRSGYPGVQRNAVIWHGDNQTWWEHLRLAIDTTLAYSISGAYYTGPDVPGFTGNPPDDLAVRFFQLGAFLPLYRGHSIFFAKDKEPYAFASPARELIREAIQLRYSLVREWIDGFAAAALNLVAPIEATFDAEGAIVRDQFLLFDKLLVAPVIERDQKIRTVYLPAGEWCPLGNPAEVHAGERWYSFPVTLASIPVFVRKGAVLRRSTPGRNVAETVGGAVREERYGTR
jgi:alpha-glucosidase